jgi:hypothetical protein
MALSRRGGGETPRNGSAKSRDDLRRLHRQAPTDRLVPRRRAALQVADVCLYAGRRRGVHPFLVAGLRDDRTGDDGAAPCWQSEADADRRDPVRRRKRPFGSRTPTPTRSR